MGVVIRQGLKSTAVQYVGVVVGVLAQLFVYTRATEAYGMVQALIAAASTLAPLAMLGSYSLAVRFFPTYTSQDGKQSGFLSFLLLLCAGGVGILALSWPWLGDWSATWLIKAGNPTPPGYLTAILVLTGLLAFGRLLSQYISNYRRIVVPTLLDQFQFKLVLPVLILALLGGYLSPYGLMLGVLVNYAVVLIGLVLYLRMLGGLHLGRVGQAVRQRWREMTGFAAFGTAGMLGGVLAFRLDLLMVAAYLDFAATGQYAMALFISDVITKPYNNLRNVVAPQLAQAWSQEDRETLRDLYRRSSDNLLAVSGYLFAGIGVCFPALTEVAANGEVLAGAFTAFLLLGAARLVDAATSVNEHIISYSPLYRFNLAAIALLAVLNVGLNIWLIPMYGLAGRPLPRSAL